MDIDWPRTIGAGAITLAVVAAIYIADAREALAHGEDPVGASLLVLGTLPGVALGIAIANLIP